MGAAQCLLVRPALHTETHSPIKPSMLATRTVDIEGLRAEDLEYNYDMVGA